MAVIASPMLSQTSRSWTATPRTASGAITQAGTSSARPVIAEPRMIVMCVAKGKTTRRMALRKLRRKAKTGTATTRQKRVATTSRAGTSAAPRGSRRADSTRASPGPASRAAARHAPASTASDTAMTAPRTTHPSSPCPIGSS